MADPYDHNQLATLSGMTITFSAERETFTLERTFDFADSPSLEAEEVAETWRELFEESSGPSGEVSVSGDTMTLQFVSDEIQTRHDLKPQIAMVASEMVSMLSTHDTEQAVEIAEYLLENAEEADDLMG